MTKDEMKKKLNMRFKSKVTGRVVIPVGKAKLAVEYMYGGKYCLKRKVNGNVTVLEMLGTMDKIVDLIFNQKLGKFKV